MIRASVVFAVLLAGIGLACNAEQPGDRFVDRFHMTGVVDYIDPGNHTIVVNDAQMRLANAVRIRSLRGRSMALAEITPGMEVGLVEASGAAESAGVISELWVLPKGFSRHE